MTAGSARVVRSITTQFLHQVAHMSRSTGFCSRIATSRPSASDACHPALSFSSTLEATSLRVYPPIGEQAIREIAVVERPWRG